MVLLAQFIALGGVSLGAWRGGPDAIAAVSASLLPSLYLALPIGALVAIREARGSCAALPADADGHRERHRPVLHRTLRRPPSACAGDQPKKTDRRRASAGSSSARSFSHSSAPGGCRACRWRFARSSA